jgi:predicted protein tyrosine phosphatase
VPVLNNMKKKLDIIVCNRDRSEKPFDFKHIMISISCPNDPVELPNSANRISVLFLKFHDFNKPIEGYKIFDEEDAKRIIDFVNMNQGSKEDWKLVVHCDAGISRSAGVAAALSKIFNDDDKYFFKHYLPNSLVYNTILKVYDEM